MSKNTDRIITVCDACLTACCWHGEFMCSESKNSGTTQKTVRELKLLNREHPDNFSIKKIKEIYGSDSIYERKK